MLFLLRREIYFHSFQRTEKGIFEATPEILAWFGPHWLFFPNVLVRRRIGENTDMALTDEDKEWIKASLKTEIERVETSLRAEIERVETNLLTAFHQWAPHGSEAAQPHRRTSCSG